MQPIILFYKSISQVGGAEILLSNHYQWFKKKDFNVKILCFDYQKLDRVNFEMDDLLEIKGMNMIQKILNLRKIIIKLNPKHIYCHSGAIDIYLSLLLKRIKYSIFYHQPASMSFNELDKFSLLYWQRFKKIHFKDLMFSALLRKYKSLNFWDHLFINIRVIVSILSLKKACKIFVLTKNAKKELKNLFDLDSISVAGALTKNKLTKLRNYKRKKIIKPNINLLTISRHDPNKRIDTIIKSLPLLIKDGFIPKLIIGGTGKETKYLKSLVKKFNISEYVSFEGYIKNEDIQSFYEKTDIFISIDWADFNLTTYEALTFKLRTIVSDETSDTELFSSGYLYSSKAKEKELFKTIKKCISCNNFWNQNKLFAHLEDYTWDNYFQKILNYTGFY